MNRATVELLSIISAAITLDALFVPMLTIGYASDIRSIIGQSRIGFVVMSSIIYLNYMVYQAASITSVCFFLINLLLRFRSRPDFDRMFIINILVMPVPIIISAHTLTFR